MCVRGLCETVSSTHYVPFSLAAGRQASTPSHTCVTPIPQAPQHPLRWSQRIHAAWGGIPGWRYEGLRV